MSFEQIRDELRSIPGLSVSGHGEGLGKFIFVKSRTRGVEMAPESEKIWIEYWEGSGEGEECKGEEIVAADFAVSKVKQWLLSGDWNVTGP